MVLCPSACNGIQVAAAIVVGCPVVRCTCPSFRLPRFCSFPSLELQARQLIARALQAETLMENYMSVLEIILRLRQVLTVCTRPVGSLGAPR